MGVPGPAAAAGRHALGQLLLPALRGRQQQQQQADASANLPGDSTLQVVILHTGKLVVDRLHPTSKPLFSSAASGAAARSGGAAQASAGKQLPGADPLLAHAPVRDSRAGAGPGARASGSGLLSFTMAEELVLGVGGTVHITYPVAMVNSYTGRNDSATAIVIELPAWST
uniref:Uncharacterized protein n=1 Tax=Chlamydomonas chlamydogama TaxID=225041 RepID=A0A7S2QT18_9CHLO|mmetsp:Transcript_1366/g.2982  ORF Transcript_1366/g.2982 Transcript_1366/m.2982 type:complete len:170 (+) Transcript_1366:551-1060(+)